MLSKAEAATFLEVSVRALERYTSQGRIKARYEKGRTRPTPVYDEAELAILKAQLNQGRFNRQANAPGDNATGRADDRATTDNTTPTGDTLRKNSANAMSGKLPGTGSTKTKDTTPADEGIRVTGESVPLMLPPTVAHRLSEEAVRRGMAAGDLATILIVDALEAGGQRQLREGLAALKGEITLLGEDLANAVLALLLFAGSVGSEAEAREWVRTNLKMGGRKA